MEGIYLRDIMILLALLALMGANAALAEENHVPYANPTRLESKNLTFSMDQNVNGEGFYSTYKYALMPNADGEKGYSYNGVEAKANAHGSGQIDTDSQMLAESKYLNRTWIDGAYDEEGELALEDEEDEAFLIDVEAGITLDEDSSITYSPKALAVGSRYYAAHPIVFNSLVNEYVSTKNRDWFNSIVHRVQYAHGLDLLLESEADVWNNSIKIDENITSGKAHFGALQLAGNGRDELPEEDTPEAYEEFLFGPAMKAWHKPDFEMDETYVGTFHIKKGLNLYNWEDDYRQKDHWLPCCSGGFSDMNMWERTEKKSAQGVFDCTCFKVPNVAQFQRVW